MNVEAFDLDVGWYLCNSETVSFQPVLISVLLNDTRSVYLTILVTPLFNSNLWISDLNLYWMVQVDLVTFECVVTLPSRLELFTSTWL